MQRKTIQAVLVSVYDVGVLIRGPSGAGKSLAALNLMRHGHKLISDDLVVVVPGPDGGVEGSPVEPDVRIEVRGLGVFYAETLFPKSVAPKCRIDFIVDLDAYDPAKDAGRLSPETGSAQLLGKRLLTVRVALPIGFDPSLVIELLAKRYRESGSVNP
jgi:HPr kinase/phosphorylase